MEDSNVAFRLKGFIDSQGLSHSQFSDRCGIPRPSLSQILSGRNKKISDVIVGQIHKAFPQLSILWLLFGEGNMLEPTASSFAQDSENEDGSIPFGDFGGDGSLFDDSDLELAADGSLVAHRNAGDAAFARKSGSDNREFPANGSANKNQANLRGLKPASDTAKELEKQRVEYEKKITELQLQIDKLRANPRKVSHITVYYDDSTFETFVPQR